MSPPLLLFGATGYTGQLVARELYRRGLPFILGGRDSERLEQLAGELGSAPVRLADARQPRTLDALLRGCRVLINCAGPFGLLGEPVVNAAVEHGVHYVDTTGEQGWMKRILNRYDGVALRNGVTVLNALAFEYAVGDWLAAVAAAHFPRGTLLDSLSVGYQVAAAGASRGTALSIWEVLGEQGWSYEGGRWRRRPVGWTHRLLPFPEGERRVQWLPLGETLLVPRHVLVQSVLTFAQLPRPVEALLPLVRRAAPLLHGPLRPLARWVVGRRPAGPDDAQRHHSHFSLTVEGRAGGTRVVRMVSGGDPYELTARIVVLGAELLLTTPAERGVRAPAHLPLDPITTLSVLGLTLHPPRIEE